MNGNNIKIEITRLWEDLNAIFTAHFSHYLIGIFTIGPLCHDLSSNLGS